MNKCLSALICTICVATGLEASSILGGSLSFTNNRRADPFADLGNFRLPFLFGKDADTTYALFGIDAEGSCGKYSQSRFITCDFAGTWISEHAIIAGRFQDVKIEALTSLIQFRPFTLRDDLSITIPFRYAFDWILKDNVPFGDTFAMANGKGRGIARLIFDGNHALQSASMDLSEAASVPEPVTLVLVGGGVVGLALWRRTRPKLESPGPHITTMQNSGGEISRSR